MSGRAKLIIGLLSVTLLVALGSSPLSVWAQSPTKTPIGPPPTKAPLQTDPPTKTPLPTDAPPAAPTATPRPTLTSVPTAHPNAVASTISPETSTATASPTPTVVATTPKTVASPTDTPAPAAILSIDTATPEVPSFTPPGTGAGTVVATPESATPVITQAINIGGFVLGLAILGLFIWFGLSRLSHAITTEIRTVSLATLRLQHEAERLARREKLAFRADSDVLALLEQVILDASGESVQVRLLPNGWLSSPPLLAVVDQTQTRYLFSPLPPDQVKALARRHGVTQFLLGQATDLTAYPIDAVTSTPFIADDLSDAFGSVLARHQTQRRPLPRTDRWYLYITRPKTSRWPRWLTRYTPQVNRLKRLAERLPFKTRSDSHAKHPTRTGD